VTTWALTLNFGTAAIYADFLTKQNAPAIYPIIFLAITVALSVRFFAFDIVMVAWIKKYAYLTEEFERIMIASQTDYEKASRLVTEIGLKKGTTERLRSLLVGQLMSGYLIILAIPSLLFVYQLVTSPPELGSWIVLIVLVAYLIYELLTFITYPRLQLNPAVKYNDDRPRAKNVQRNALRGTLQVLWLVLCGWAGEFPYFISLGRSINDWLRTGAISAHPRVVSWTLDIYGLSWKVAFYRGGPVDLGILVDNGLGIALLAGILFIFIELLKSRL
jgi:hypothetical protein